jgi:hypothetical protein
VLLPVWQFRCITCGDLFTRTRPRPKIIRCRRCIAGFIPSTATERRRQHNDGVWTRRLDRLADGQRAATEQTPETPPTRPRKPPPWQPEHQSAAVIAPTSGVFTD